MDATSVPLIARPLEADDLDEVVRIDTVHTGEAKPEYWARLFGRFLGASGSHETFGFGVQRDGGLAGYLLAEIRAVEFGSDACGWVFAVGVEEGWKRRGVASLLLEAACRTFQQMGMHCVRTMVRRNDVPVLSFFRSSGFVGGPYVQLELDLGEGDDA